MAVDTKLKRYSAIHVALPFRCMLPDPDGVISAYDRMAVAFMYAGIAAAAAVLGDLMTITPGMGTGMTIDPTSGTQTGVMDIAATNTEGVMTIIPENKGGG